jgi:hypothetical protein
MPESKAPVLFTESPPKKAAAVADREVPGDEAGRSESGYYADTPAKESRGNEDTYRPAPVLKSESDSPTEPEQVAALEEAGESSLDLRKREALAAPEVRDGTDADGADAASGQDAEGVLSQNPEAEKPLASPPAVVDDSVVALGEADKGAPVVLSDGKLDQTKTASVEAVPAQVEGQTSTAPMVMAAEIDPAGGRDDQAQEMAAVPPPEPSVPSVTAGTVMSNNAVMSDNTFAAAAEEQKNKSALFTPDEPSDESKAVVSGMETLESSMPSGDAKPVFASRASPYRGPEDQLIHARNLADVRKFWESEQVLKDLISQHPPSPVQEEASILLVKVLSSQNRAVEAQQVLDDARVQFPASEMVQTFDLKQEGGGQTR